MDKAMHDKGMSVRRAVLGDAPRVGVEAAVRLGWDRWIIKRVAALEHVIEADFKYEKPLQ